MSSITWTAGAIASSATSLNLACWRVVQGRSAAASAKLTDSLAEQMALENVIDEFERDLVDIPQECRHLDRALSGPFRAVPYRSDSRFRRAGSSTGVFYSAENRETALAEGAFYRLLFFAESPDTSWPSNPIEHSAFSASIASERAIDLTKPALDRDHALWTDRTNYAACLELSDVAREAGIEIIRYESVRDPQARANVAVLTCRAIDGNRVRDQQTWHFQLDRNGVRATCESPYAALEFGRNAFSADRRIAAMNWERR
jgi:RES domain